MNLLDELYGLAACLLVAAIAIPLALVSGTTSLAMASVLLGLVATIGWIAKIKEEIGGNDNNGFTYRGIH